MNVFFYGRTIDLSPNITIIKKWSCKTCGKKNPPTERIDTQAPLGGDEESFCIEHWLKRLGLF